jgi:glycosyltransferase involved in cell wall biosynthesis
MRILYHYRTSASDGSAVHINGLVGALRALGAEVMLVGPAASVAKSGEPRRSGTVHRMRKALPRGAHEVLELGYNVPEAARLARAVREFDPDIVYQRSNLYLLSGAWVARRFGLPLIEEVNAPYFAERSRHGGLLLSRLAEWSERTAWQRADAVITVTGVLADIVVKAGVPRDKLHVMPNGIDEELLEVGAVDPCAKERLGLSAYTVLGFTGYIRDWNGLDAVLELLAQERARRCFLMIVGDGPARGGLEQRARELGVAERVRITGIVGRGEIPGYVSAFDVALQPAANPYASPLKLFEYMALGRAIVAPDQPNIGEVLTNERDAHLFAAGDHRGFAEATLRLASDAELRFRLSQEARRTVLRRQFTWKQNAQRVLDLGCQLLTPSASELRLGGVGGSGGTGPQP